MKFSSSTFLFLSLLPPFGLALPKPLTIVSKATAKAAAGNGTATPPAVFTPSDTQIMNAVLSWMKDTGKVSKFLDTATSFSGEDFTREATIALNAEKDELNHKKVLDDALGKMDAVQGANAVLDTQGTFQMVVDVLQSMVDNGPDMAQAQVDAINLNRCVNVLPNIDTYYSAAGQSTMSAIRATGCVEATAVATGANNASSTANAAASSSITTSAGAATTAATAAATSSAKSSSAATRAGSSATTAAKTTSAKSSSATMAAAASASKTGTASSAVSTATSSSAKTAAGGAASSAAAAGATSSTSSSKKAAASAASTTGSANASASAKAASNKASTTGSSTLATSTTKVSAAAAAAAATTSSQAPGASGSKGQEKQ